jgi:hypothetical protein
VTKPVALIISPLKTNDFCESFRGLTDDHFLAKSDAFMETKTKKSQAMKYQLAMAGEYFVAAQLQRLQVFASVVY